MSHDWRRDARAAADAFRRLVVPVIAPWFDSDPSQWVNREGTTEDRDYGVDWIVVRPKPGGVSGGIPVSARVQYGRDQEHATFTIRNEGSQSELAKRVREARIGNGYDLWMAHAYVGRGPEGVREHPPDRLLSVGIIRLRDLLLYTAEHMESIGKRRNGSDGNRFVYVRWSDLAAAGVPSLRAVGYVTTGTFIQCVVCGGRATHHQLALVGCTCDKHWTQVATPVGQESA